MRLLYSPKSDFVLSTDGRRPIFLTMLPILVVGSIGTAAARSVPTLLFWRIVQSLGSSGGFSVGAGAIADVYALEQRGKATGIFFSVRASVLGPPYGRLLIGLLRRLHSLDQHSHPSLVVRSRTMHHGESCSSP